MTRGTLLGSTAAGALLLLAAPRPAAALHSLTSPDSLTSAGGAAAPTAPLVAAVALLSWLLVAWLALTALLTVGSSLRGPLGVACAAVLRRAAPAALRRAVAVALGVGIVLGGAGPAHAATPTAPPPTAAALDWPVSPTTTSPAPVSEPALDWPVPTPGPAGSVVVRPGDSLWRLAAEHLPSTARRADVAAAWPAWWSANRAVIGPDPDLLHPGQRLAVPPVVPPVVPRADPPAPH